MELFAYFGGVTELGWIVRNLGPYIGVIVFFIWRDYCREDKLLTRVKELEDEQRNVILPLVRDCSAVVAKNTLVMEQNFKVMERLERIFERSLT